MTRHSNMRLTFEAFIDGKRVGRKQLSRSFVNNLARWLYAHMSTASPGNGTNVAGSSITPSATTTTFQSTGGLDISGNGIVVGTGTTAIATTDTKLVTQIATGNGAGQLRYLAQTYNLFTVGSIDTSFQITRSFINNSGATITPTELGIYGAANTSSIICMVRDLFSGGGIAVAAGKTLTVTYTWSFPL